MKKAITFFVVVVAWYVASLFSNPIFIPSPLSVVDAFIQTIQSGMLVKAFGYSFARITIASVLSAATAIPIAVAVKHYKNLNETIKPLLDSLRYVPVTAFYPLLIMWFGIGESMKIAFLFFATFIYMLPSAVIIFNDVNQNLIDTGKTIGMSDLQIITKVVLPASAPSIAQTFLMMYGIGWTYIAIAETTNAKYGLGFTIAVSSARGQTNLVFMAIITIMLASVLFDKAGKWIIERCFKWRT